jgi:signal transduction histidine kinase
MAAGRIQPAVLSRMIAAAGLLVGGLLVLGPPFAVRASARGIALIVLGLALADLLAFAFEFARSRRLGASPGVAALAALRSASRDGATATLVFGAGWLLARPSEPTSLASFAILEACALLLILVAPLVVRLAPVHSWHGLGRPRQRAMLLLACIAPAASLVATGWFSVWTAPAQEFVCPLLHNGVVPASGIFSRGCPLQPLDRVVEVWVPGDRGPFRGLADLEAKAAQWPDFVEWTVERDGQRVTEHVARISVPMRSRLGRFATAFLLAAALMATGLIIAWNTASAAAVPFLLFTAVISSGLASAICAGSDEFLRLACALCNASYAPVLAHLALRFPRDRISSTRIRLLPGAYYAAGLLLVGLELFAYRNSAALWILLERMMPLFAFIGWVGMLLGAADVLRSSQVPFDRQRARAFLIGSASVVALAVVMGELFRSPTPFVYRTGISAVVLLQIPIAVALVRYSVFDLQHRARRTIQAVAYSTGVAGILTLLALLAGEGRHDRVPFEHAGLLFSALVVIFLAADALRSWLSGPGWELMSGAARRRRSAELRCAQQLAELRDPDACARILAEAIVDGTRASWVSVFLRSPALGMRPAYATGSGAVLSPELARESDASTPRGQVLHLSRSTQLVEQEHLTAAGIDVVVPLHTAAGTAGLVLVGRREEVGPYTLDELEYLSTLGAQGGVALDNARLARELVDAERNAARGNLAVGLAHELGKPLRVIEDLARSLHKGGDRQRFRRDLQQISEISQELIRTVYGFVQSARSGEKRRGVAAADAVTRAVRSIEHLHGTDRVSVSLAPDLPDVVGGGELATVLSNLLDNALLASAAGDSVQLIANCDERELRLEVVDDGHGMDEATASRAFELFFTTRAGRGGSGIGLALCREIVDQLGGRIELNSRPGKGTRVVVRLPRAASTADEGAGSTPEPAPG